ncbi:MAG: DUF1015 domain-containing protein, partial [Synergistaceae bacterium]|nr:DUF1015 domain-containing protein [Synergistaceae bacterium]
MRPIPEYASLVASQPYDVLTREEAVKRAGKFSFLHVVKSEIDLPADVGVFSDAVYEKARENLDDMARDGILISDESPCMYIYRLTWNGRSQTGLAACVSVDGYLSGVIKKHELTIEAKELDRTRHIMATDANTGPVFLAYRASAQVRDIMNGWIVNNRAVYDFIADDDVWHEVWVIDRDEVINRLVECFAKIPNLYIADGHHRNASAAKACLERRRRDDNARPDAEYNFYMAVIFPDDELYIMDYNRLVRDLNGYSKRDFLDALEEKWLVSPVGDADAKPVRKHTYGMYLGEWYRLEAKGEIIPGDMIGALDVSLLQDGILTPL